MIELIRDLRAINVLAKFENDPWKIVDVRVLTGLVCPAARPLGRRQYPGALWHQLKINNWYHFHFNYHLVYFQLKTNSVGITEVSVVPMANNMYFIQWIIASYYQDGYKSYINNSVGIKIAHIKFCSHILSRFKWYKSKQNTIILWWISSKTRRVDCDADILSHPGP